MNEKEHTIIFGEIIKLHENIETKKFNTIFENNKLKFTNKIFIGFLFIFILCLLIGLYIRDFVFLHSTLDFTCKTLIPSSLAYIFAHYYPKQ